MNDKRSLPQRQKFQRPHPIQKIDEQLSVSVYLKKSCSTIDGLSWLLTCFFSAICLVDILLETNWFPLRDVQNPSKAIVLLLFSPLIVFLVLIISRQLPSSENDAGAWIRAAICIFIFLIINF